LKKIICFIVLVLLTGCSEIAEIPKDNSNSNNNAIPPIESVEPSNPEDTSLFHEYKEEAMDTLKNLTLEEKVGQMFLVRCPAEEYLDLFLSMNPAGFILFGKDFAEITKEEVIRNIENYQEKSKIPMIIGVDEEGGTVVRVSSNPLLSKERFKSPQELYNLGGLEEIKRDTLEKSKLLLNLGINLNLSPVADVSINETDFINPRAFGKSAEYTATYVNTVVSAMNDTGISSTLKHFPGYGNNVDTHTGSAYDTRPYAEFIKNDFLPFKAGIESGAESILVSHNVVEAIDANLPASLSKKVLDILRNDMNFTGIIMTDDLSMGAVSELEMKYPTEVLSVIAGNDMMIVTDYEESFNSLLNSVNTGEISIDRINDSVLRILKWKYYMGIM